jgi:hypothetical protein
MISRRPEDEDRENVLGGVRWLLESVVLRWAFLMGAVVMAIGLALLTGAWLNGPRMALLEREIRQMSARAEAETVDPWWEIDVELARVAPDVRWEVHTQARLCATVVYVLAGERHQRLLCGAERGGRLPLDLVETWALMPGVGIDWPRDASGLPRVEVRMRPAAVAFLREHALFEPHAWQMRVSPKGSEAERTARRAELEADPPDALDLLLLELDRPLEWLARSWPARDDTRFEMRVDPREPGKAWPAVFADGVQVHAGHWVFSAFLAVTGLLVWWQGIRIGFIDLSLRARLAVAVVPLLLAPWWGGCAGHLMQRLAPDAWGLGRDLAADLGMQSRRALAAPDPASFAGHERIVWSASGDASAYAEVFGRVPLRRPEPAPADADAALAEAARQLAAAVAAMPEAEASALFETLIEAERAGRVEVSLLFLRAAREAALDPDRGVAVGRRAGQFLSLLTTQPYREPEPDAAGFAARKDLWRSLLDFPPDPAVVNRTRWMIERVEAARAAHEAQVEP